MSDDQEPRVRGTGVNSQGNRYINYEPSPSATNPNPYEYRNLDDSRYILNEDGSRYHEDGQGLARVAPPGENWIPVEIDGRQYDNDGRRLTHQEHVSRGFLPAGGSSRGANRGHDSESEVTTPSDRGSPSQESSNSSKDTNESPSLTEDQREVQSSYGRCETQADGSVDTLSLGRLSLSTGEDAARRDSRNQSPATADNNQEQSTSDDQDSPSHSEQQQPAASSAVEQYVEIIGVHDEGQSFEVAAREEYDLDDSGDDDDGGYYDDEFGDEYDGFGYASAGSDDYD